MMRRRRGEPGWWAFLVHRLSGLALVLFLPLHFLGLATALGGKDRMDAFLTWTAQPWVVAGEWILVTLLAAHLAGGLRLLALEFLPWRDWQKTLAALAAGFAVIAGLVFAWAR